MESGEREPHDPDSAVSAESEQGFAPDGVGGQGSQTWGLLHPLAVSGPQA